MKFQKEFEVLKNTSDNRTYKLLIKKKKINEWGLCFICPLYDGENWGYGNYILKRKYSRSWKSYRKKQYKVE